MCGVCSFTVGNHDPLCVPRQQPIMHNLPLNIMDFRVPPLKSEKCKPNSFAVLGQAESAV